MALWLTGGYARLHGQHLKDPTQLLRLGGTSRSRWLLAPGLSFGAFLASAFLPFVARRAVRSRKTRPLNVPSASSSIDVIVPAYLEAGTIDAKVRSLKDALVRHTAPGKVIVVASDESTAVQASGADLVVVTGRMGKATACNIGVEKSDADVVVFTDANCEIAPADWPRLVIEGLQQFDLVSALKDETGGADQLFWRFENRVKGSNADGETLAVVGEFLATPRPTFNPIPAKTVLDDFQLAAAYMSRGLTVGVKSEIRTLESAAGPSDQWERRVRIAQGLLTEALPKTTTLLRHPVGRAFLLHKVYRVTIGCLGFWVSVIATVAISPLAGLLILPALICAYLTYRGLFGPPAWLRSLVAPVGMQFIPPTALARVVRGTFNSTAHPSALWRKVPR